MCSLPLSDAEGACPERSRRACPEPESRASSVHRRRRRAAARPARHSSSIATVGWIVTAVVSFGLFVAGASTLIAASSWPAWAMAAVADRSGSAVTAGLGWWLQVWPAISLPVRVVRRRCQRHGNPRGRRVADGDERATVARPAHGRLAGPARAPVRRRRRSSFIRPEPTPRSSALHGLTHETALAIRDHLLPREGPDAV